MVGLGPHKDLDYRNYYAGHAMGRIADLKVEADNRTANPISGLDPPLHLNLGRLGWDLSKIERDGVSFANHKIDLNFYDTTTGKPVMRNLRDTTTDASSTMAGQIGLDHTVGFALTHASRPRALPVSF